MDNHHTRSASDYTDHAIGQVPFNRLLSASPVLAGVLNVTPDSFSDGGRYLDVNNAVAHGLEMAKQGAGIIDVGGESSRPGAERVTAEVQIQRVRPVIRALRDQLDQTCPHVLISIDTTRSDVARAAADAGAVIINDISAGRDDPDLFTLAADRGLHIVLMHMQGRPADMQNNPTYTDVVQNVRQFLLKQAKTAKNAGIRPDHIAIDPGIGFGKTLEHNLTLLAGLSRLVDTGYPVMIGMSRKRFIAGLTPQSAEDPDSRLPGTIAGTVLAALAGVSIIRVHDVAENRQALDLFLALKNLA